MSTISEDNSHRCQHWQVNISIDEREDHVRAVAQMQYRERTLVGVGRTRLDPGYRYPDAVVEELVVGRALADLTRHLFAVTAQDIEAVADDKVSAS